MSLRSLLKKNTRLHFLYTLYKDKKFRKGYLLYLGSTRLKKSRSIIKEELRFVHQYWNYPPYHYYRYKLYQIELNEDQLLDYIPPFCYFNIYWEERNNELDETLYESKIYQHQLFAKYNIPALEIVATVRDSVLYDYEDAPMTIEDLIGSYLNTENDALFCKPEYGRGGRGIIHLSKRNNTVFLNSRAVPYHKILSFFAKDENYIIQERFVQSKKMAEINESSVNTLRIYTQVKDDDIVLSACILRMGNKNSIVDNLSQGGLMNMINVNDGSLSDFARIKLEDKKYFEHPDSKYVFKNSKIDNWQEIKSQIIRFSGLLSECKDLGWDVAINENGFKVLEINIQHGIDHPQMIFGGMRRILGVYPAK